MPMSVAGRPPAEQSIRTIHAALDGGVTLVDTADAYCTSAADVGHNERLVARALRSYPGAAESVVIATKGGHVRPPDGSWQLDGRPEHLRRACDASLLALGVEVIDLYQFHRPDPRVPFAESVGAIAALREDGKVRDVGISNVSIAQIDEACGIVEVASVQNEFSPDLRSSDAELAHCERLGIAFLAYSPLGGAGAARTIGRRHPRFAEVAAARGVSPQQVVLAWVAAQSPAVIPIAGASRPETIRDSSAAAELDLSAAEREALDGV